PSVASAKRIPSRLQGPLDESTAQHFLAAVKYAGLPRGYGGTARPKTHPPPTLCAPCERRRGRILAGASPSLPLKPLPRAGRIHQAYVSGQQPRAVQLFAPPHYHGAGVGVNLAHVHRLAGRKAEAPALADREVMHTAMRAEPGTGTVDDWAGADAIAAGGTF